MFSTWRLGVLAGLAAGVLCAQQAPGAVSASQRNSLAQAEAGLEGPDAARRIVAAIVQQSDAIKPALASLNPQSWEAKGAPSSYTIQWQLIQRQVNDIDLASKAFQSHLDSLAAAMDFYFRLEALETTSRALNEGAQRYGEHGAAGQLDQFVAKNFDSRQRLRDYLRELSTNLEQNYKVADEEAQRCRAAVNSTNNPCESGGKRKRG